MHHGYSPHQDKARPPFLATMKIGSTCLGKSGCEFAVWAPLAKSVSLKLLTPAERVFKMERDRGGYWRVGVDKARPGARYLYRLEDETERPDPASHFQPEGVHGPSQAVDHSSFDWEDRAWRGISLSEMIMYEIHVGTFTEEGTFDGAIKRLDDLGRLGINAVELMPVAQFPGDRNWGYDGVYPFAVQDSYGGPEGLKGLVNACHMKGIAVILDVVYNHLGPEGNYLWDYGPYFTPKYKTPWGDALNFDGAYSDGVKNFFIENALHWFGSYHIDGLRLDAIHGITDMSAAPFLQQLAERVGLFSETQGRKHYLIAESDLNDSRVIRSGELGGYGFDALWCDDFHHSLHCLLTGDKAGYYVDFGKMGHFTKALREGFVYSGEYSEYRKRSHGNSSKDRPARRFVIFSQNHDQTGNRMLGERLSSLVSFEALKLAAGAVLLSPYVPLLFMGEEYGEEAPFLYFVSHIDPGLVEAVRKGRKEEFRAFGWKGEPPDPEGVETFLRAKLRWDKRRSGKHKVLSDFYAHLIGLRKAIPALSNLDKDCLEVSGLEEERVLFLRRWKGDNLICCIFNFGRGDVTVKVPLTGGRWKKMLDSSDSLWNGPGSRAPEELSPGEEVAVRRESFVLYEGITGL